MSTRDSFHIYFEPMSADDNDLSSINKLEKWLSTLHQQHLASSYNVEQNHHTQRALLYQFNSFLHLMDHILEWTLDKIEKEENIIREQLDGVSVKKQRMKNTVKTITKLEFEEKTEKYEGQLYNLRERRDVMHSHLNALLLDRVARHLLREQITIFLNDLENIDYFLMDREITQIFSRAKEIFLTKECQNLFDSVHEWNRHDISSLLKLRENEIDESSSSFCRFIVPNMHDEKNENFVLKKKKKTLLEESVVENVTASVALGHKPYAKLISLSTNQSTILSHRFDVSSKIDKRSCHSRQNTITNLDEELMEDDDLLSDGGEGMKVNGLVFPEKFVVYDGFWVVNEPLDTSDLLMSLEEQLHELVKRLHDLLKERAKLEYFEKSFSEELKHLVKTMWK